MSAAAAPGAGAAGTDEDDAGAAGTGRAGGFGVASGGVMSGAALRMIPCVSPSERIAPSRLDSVSSIVVPHRCLPVTPRRWSQRAKGTRCFSNYGDVSEQQRGAIQQKDIEFWGASVLYWVSSGDHVSSSNSYSQRIAVHVVIFQRKCFKPYLM